MGKNSLCLLMAFTTGHTLCESVSFTFQCILPHLKLSACQPSAGAAGNHFIMHMAKCRSAKITLKKRIVGIYCLSIRIRLAWPMMTISHPLCLPWCNLLSGGWDSINSFPVQSQSRDPLMKIFPFYEDKPERKRGSPWGRQWIHKDQPDLSNLQN